MASSLGAAFLAMAAVATPATAGTWQGTLGVDWDSAGPDYQEYFDAQVNVDSSDDSTARWSLYGPFSATWSNFYPGDENNPSCTTDGTITSPAFVPNPGTTDQFLAFENSQDLSQGAFDPRKGTYTLQGPHVMIEPSESPEGCGHFYNGDPYQWHPQQPELLLTLPTEGERAPRVEAGGKLHWQGTQSLATSVFDTSYTAVWTYDLTYDPGGIEKCSLTAAIPQKLASALKAQVRGGTEGCAAKVTSVKYKVGNKVFTYIRKKPQKTVAPGEVWRLSFPVKGAFRTIVAKALRAKKTVLGKVTAELDAAPDDIVVRIK